MENVIWRRRNASATMDIRDHIARERLASMTVATMEFARIIDASATPDTRVLIAPSRRVLHHVVYMAHATMVRAAATTAGPELPVRFKYVIHRVKMGDCVWTTCATAATHMREILVRIVRAARNV